MSEQTPVFPSHFRMCKNISRTWTLFKVCYGSKSLRLPGGDMNNRETERKRSFAEHCVLENMLWKWLLNDVCLYCVHYENSGWSIENINFALSFVLFLGLVCSQFLFCLFVQNLRLTLRVTLPVACLWKAKNYILSYWRTLCCWIYLTHTIKKSSSFDRILPFFYAICLQNIVKKFFSQIF